MSNVFTASARRFRIVLLIALTASMLIAVGVVVYGVGQLNTFADSVNQEVYAASNSESSLNNMRSQVRQLENNQAAVQRAKQIVAESQEYRYQDTIISDIERFAQRSGIRVNSYDFTSSEDSGAAPSNTPPPTPAPTAGGAVAGPQPLSAGDSGSIAQSPTQNLRSVKVNISIESPVNYRNYLNFLNYIEQNLTKMQISRVSLASGESSSSVTTDSLELEVYIR